MDDFLTRLYEEEQEKTASAEYLDLVSELGVEELEDVLELTKTALHPEDNPRFLRSVAAGTREAGGHLDKGSLKRKYKESPVAMSAARAPLTAGALGLAGYVAARGFGGGRKARRVAGTVGGALGAAGAIRQAMSEAKRNRRLNEEMDRQKDLYG